MSKTIKVTDHKHLLEVLYQLRQGDEITYEASGGGRKGKVDVSISEVGEAGDTYCIFGTGKQEGEYVIFPGGRPSGQKYDPPEACYIRGERKPPLSNLELLTHGTIQKLYIDNRMKERFDNNQHNPQRQQVQDSITSLLSVYDQAKKLTADGNLSDARSKLKKLKPYIDHAKKRAQKHGFDDLSRDITTLERRRKDSLEEITKRIQARLIPEEIPQTPTHSIDYNSLRNKEPIGTGGNADVYRAKVSTDSGEFELGIKEPRMAGTIDTTRTDQLLEEAETWRQLDDHDHIVSIVDYGAKPLPWIAMEYMDGGDLGQRTGKLPFEQALWTALSITRGIRYAHKRGVAHLDLKPANILFRSIDNAWDVPKIGDWGLSKHLLDHSQNVDGLSPQYAAPEQFDSDQFGSTDSVTDVYQLGAVCYELFTGHPPFESDRYETVNRVQTESPAPPSRNADLPQELDDILLQALATEKQNRYEDIILMRKDLEKLWNKCSFSNQG
jgi:hypothetical protein